MYFSTRLKGVLLLCSFAVFVSDAYGIPHHLEAPSAKPVVERPIRVGAFNIENLGTSKISNPVVLERIAKIVTRYDLLAVEEISVKNDKILDPLVDKVNELAPEGVLYNIEISDHIGTGGAKEKYGFFYREDKIKILESEAYPDPDGRFTRPPFIAIVASPTARKLPKFAAVAVHTSPSKAANESSALAEVYDYIVEQHGLEDAIIMGDFNLGCSTVRKKDWPNIELWTRKEFEWLIGNHVDTTTSSSSCPYDRIVINGDKMKEAVIRESAGIFNYRNEFDLDEEETGAISDHWPVEVLIRGAISTIAERYLQADACFRMLDKRTIPNLNKHIDELKKFSKKRKSTKDEKCEDSGLELEFESTKIEAVLQNFREINEKFPDVLSREAIEGIEYKLENGGLDDASSYGSKKRIKYSGIFYCDLQELQCTTVVCKQTSIN